MPIFVTCSCGVQQSAPDAAAGKAIRCRVCKGVIRIPSLTPPPAAPQPPAQPAPRPSHGKWLVAGGILAVLLFGALATAGTLIYLSVHKNRQAEANSTAKAGGDRVARTEDKNRFGSKILDEDAPGGKKTLLEEEAPVPRDKIVGQDAPPRSTKPLETEERPPAKKNLESVPPQPKTKPDSSLAPITKVTFLNTTAQGRRFCIIADNSGSMTGEPMAFLKRELGRTLDDLKPESKFYVTFFNTRAEPMPYDSWLQGTLKNREKVNDWIKGKSALGGTFPQQAFALAFKLDPRPDVIFFMTDGLIPFNVPDAVAAMNASKPRVTIHTIMFTSEQRTIPGLFFPAIGMRDMQIAEGLLRKIADDSGGTYRLYTPCTPEELAQAAEAGDVKRLRNAIDFIPRMMPEARKVIPRLLAALLKPREEARALILDALGKMGPMEPAHIPALIALLKEPADALQLFALPALAALRGKAIEALDPMKKLFADSEKQAVLLAVLKALRSIIGPDLSLVEMYRDRGLKKRFLEVRLASLAALNDIGGDALPFRLLAQLSFDDANRTMRGAAQDILRAHMKEITEDDLGNVRILLDMKKHPEAVELGLVGVTRLGPKAKDCLPRVVDSFLGNNDSLCKASAPALRAMGEAARPATTPLLESLPKASQTRQRETAFILAAIDPANPKVAQAVTPLLVGNLHPDALDKKGPPKVLLDSIASIGAPTVEPIFAALEAATQRGAVPANHRKYLLFALERLGRTAYTKKRLDLVHTYTSPKLELYADVREAAGKAWKAMSP